jgi:hypothetical protein
VSAEGETIPLYLNDSALLIEVTSAVRRVTAERAVGEDSAAQPLAGDSDTGAQASSPA